MTATQAPGMPRSSTTPSPPVAPFSLAELGEHSEHEVLTADGWRLTLTRFAPKQQPFAQPIFGEPVLFVHGFSQDHTVWTRGELVKNLLRFGADVFLLDLRGHGLSSRERQLETTLREGTKLPADWDWGWDVDSYFCDDIPAALEAVKRATGRPKLFYCGHSLGGMLGYGLASLRHDLAGLITIGAPGVVGVDNRALRLAAWGALLLPLGDLALEGVNRARRRLRQARHAVHRLRGGEDPLELLGGLEHRDWRFRYLPIDKAVRAYGWLITESPLVSTELGRILARGVVNPDRASREEIAWLLHNSAFPEPRGVFLQIARWIREGCMASYRLDWAFPDHWHEIRAPLLIVFGDVDPFCSLEATRGVYRAASSEYLAWRPVRGNSHVELTMGYDVRQLAYDIKNLVEYATTHPEGSPTLPRTAAWKLRQTHSDRLRERG